MLFRSKYDILHSYHNCFDLSFHILVRITIFVLDVLIIFIYLQIASHKQLLTCYIVGSPEYN